MKNIKRMVVLCLAFVAMMAAFAVSAGAESLVRDDPEYIYSTEEINALRETAPYLFDGVWENGEMAASQIVYEMPAWVVEIPVCPPLGRAKDTWNFKIDLAGTSTAEPESGNYKLTQNYVNYSISPFTWWNKGESYDIGYYSGNYEMRLYKDTFFGRKLINDHTNPASRSVSGTFWDLEVGEKYFLQIYLVDRRDLLNSQYLKGTATITY